MPKPIVTVDCTLRDGGYYNKWDFPPDVVQRYLDAMERLSIDYIEFGFRGFKQDQFLGAHAFSRDSYIEQFEISGASKIAVMVNAGDLLRFNDGASKHVRALFSSADQSPVTAVRIAAHFEEYRHVFPAVHELQDLGYEVGINLMQVANRTPSEIEGFLEDIKNLDLFALYMADSTGSLNVKDTKSIVKQFVSGWSGDVGVHMHDNMGLAIQNTLEAISVGANFVDSTVTGMGRGPGNAQTEYLIAEPLILGEKRVDPIPLMGLIDDYFQPKKKKCGWGKNYYYYLAGQAKIHPTYIQEMLEDDRYGAAEILDSIAFLRDNAKKFNRELLNDALAVSCTSIDGAWCPSSMLKEKEILLVAAGPSVKQYCSAIENFIGKEKPIVIVLNMEKVLAESHVDLRIACHAKRIINEYSAYGRANEPIVMPTSSVADSFGEDIKSFDVLNFGLAIEPGKFEFHENGATVPVLLSLAYGIALANSGEASKIYVAGMDGYAVGDTRNHDLEQMLASYHNLENKVDLVSITPSLFNVKFQSVFSF